MDRNGRDDNWKPRSDSRGGGGGGVHLLSARARAFSALCGFASAISRRTAGLMTTAERVRDVLGVTEY